ncbi:MAG: hypothetical protein Q7K45_04230, partial [Nanoarchaeota archaeon]|nr:hypothetical protein [Nanoarchaeota archaeon]
MARKIKKSTRTSKKELPEIKFLLPQLEERGFEKVTARDVEEALDILDYKCVVGEEGGLQFYHAEIKKDGPLEISLSPVESTEEVFDFVSAYLMSNPHENHDQKYTVAKKARFLPDPSEPNTDLVELALEQARVSGQYLEREAKINLILQKLSATETDLAKEELRNYFSLLEQHMPGVIIHGKEAVDQTTYIEKLFAGPLAVRGRFALDAYFEDLENIAAEGVAEVTTAFLESAPTLYRQLSYEDAQHFVKVGVEEVQRYKETLADLREITPDSIRENLFTAATQYFSLESDTAKQTINYLIVREHEALVPLYGQLKEELKNSEQRGDTLRQDITERIRTYEQLTVEKEDLALKLKIEKAASARAHRDSEGVNLKYAECDRKYAALQLTASADAAALETAREKNTRLEDALRGRDTAYQTAVKERDSLNEELTKVNSALFVSTTNYEQ